MGVLACDRNGCGNIMCDRFSYELQMYICNECFEELVETGATTDIESFMNSSRKRQFNTGARERYEAVFPLT